PEGFRHAPFSKPGCVLFVKLRQYAGRDRRHVVIDTNRVDWLPSTTAGIACKPLYEQEGFTDRVRLERWAPCTEPGAGDCHGGIELLVLDGDFEIASSRYSAGCWLRFPSGAQCHPRTNAGCTLYVKRGGLRYLRSGDAE